MSFFHLIEGVFLKLSIIPGLGFLEEYVHELETSNSRRKQQIEKYRGYGRALRESGSDVRHGGHHGHHDHDEHDEHAKHGKQGKHGDRAGRPGSGGHVHKGHEKEEEPDGLEEDYYEDDDFESYLQ